MSYYPQGNPAQNKGSRKAFIIILIIALLLVAMCFVLFGIPGTSFHGLARPTDTTPTPTPTTTTTTTTTPTQTPTTEASPINTETTLDGTYTVDVTGAPIQVPVADDPTDNPNTYAFYNVESATVTIKGPEVTLTLSRLCLTYLENYVCVDQVPLTWTGTLTGNTAVVQDTNHPISWTTVTVANNTATLTRPNLPEPCLLPDGTTAGSGDAIGDVHFSCTQ